MADSRIFDKTLGMLSSSLDVSARRHNLITGNIANMDTIGYKPKDLDFQSTLKRVLEEPEPKTMETTHGNHFTGSEPVDVNMTGSVSEDVDIYHLDSVNIDREMEHLVENNIKYRTTTEMLLRKMSTLRHAITEGGR